MQVLVSKGLLVKTLAATLLKLHHLPKLAFQLLACRLFKTTGNFRKGCMLRSSVFVVMASVSVSMFFCQMSAADSIELIANGEFEEDVVTSSFNKFQNAQVPNWTNSSGQVELWASAFQGSPLLGTDGNPTGQHLELSTNGSGEVTTQDVSIPNNSSGTAFLSFDGWARSGMQQINIELTGDSGQIFSASFVVNNLTWTHFDSGPIPVVAGENVEVKFTYEGGDGGPHIDQVSLLVETCCKFESNNILCTLDHWAADWQEYSYRNIHQLAGYTGYAFVAATGRNLTRWCQCLFWIGTASSRS